MTDTQDTDCSRRGPDAGRVEGAPRELSPHFLNFAMLLAGVRPRSVERGFAYCKLGRDVGMTVNLLAASNPPGQFYGIMADAAQVATSTRLAEAANMTNVTFVERSFEQLMSLSLPSFDFVSLPDDWACLAPADRDAIVRFLDSKVKPGGLVYVGYHCLPGCSAEMTLRRVYSAYRNGFGGTEIDRVAHASEALRKALGVQSGCVREDPRFSVLRKRIESATDASWALDIDDCDFFPMYHADVASEMARAALSFACSATLIDNITGLCVYPDAIEIIEQARTSIAKQTLYDCYTNRSFRRDIFVRGIPRMDLAEQVDLLSTVPFLLQIPHELIKYKVQAPIGEVECRTDLYKPIVDELAKGVRTASELAKLPALAKMPGEALFEALTVLAFTGEITPAPRSQDTSLAQRLNRELLSRARFGGQQRWIASATTGWGVEVDWISQLFLLAEMRPDARQDPPRFAAGVLSNQGAQVVEHGRVICNFEDMLGFTRKSYKAFSEVLRPMLTRLGVL